MSTTPNAGIPVLPPNTLVPLQIGTGFVGKLYELMGFLVMDKSSEEIEALDKAIKDNTYENEPWMKHYVTVLSLLKGIEEAAIENNLVTYKEPNELDS